MNTTAGYHHNWIEHILPYMEEQNAFNAIDQSVSVYDPKNAPVIAHMPRWLMCPSNGAGRGFACYAACHHDKEKSIDTRDKGVFFLNSGVRYEDITDGSSHTLFVGEKLPDAWDLNWLSGTRATLRNTGVPINWLTPRNGLPAPGGATQPPAAQQAAQHSKPTTRWKNSSGQTTPAAGPAVADAVNAAAQSPTPAADRSQLMVCRLHPRSDLPKRPYYRCPDHPRLLAGLAARHPGGVISAMGDGSGAIYQPEHFAAGSAMVWPTAATGKLPDNDFLTT